MTWYRAWYRVGAEDGVVHLSILPEEPGGVDLPLPIEEAKRLAEDLARAVLEAKKQRKGL